MRVISALAVLAVGLSLGGCSRADRTAYAKPLPSPLPHPTKASSVKPGPLPVRKPPEPTKVTAVKPPPPPIGKLPVETKTSSVKPPPLPPKKPPQSASVHPPTTAEAKFKAAQEKAKLSGVHTLTQEDIDGLSYEQIKELRGY